MKLETHIPFRTIVENLSQEDFLLLVASYQAINEYNFDIDYLSEGLEEFEGYVCSDNEDILINIQNTMASVDEDLYDEDEKCDWEEDDDSDYDDELEDDYEEDLFETNRKKSEAYFGL